MKAGKKRAEKKTIWLQALNKSVQWLIFFRFSDVKVAKLHLEQLQYLTNFDAIEIKISNFQFNTIVGDKKSNFAKNFDVLLFVYTLKLLKNEFPAP